METRQSVIRRRTSPGGQTPGLTATARQRELINEAEQVLASMREWLRITCEEIERARVCMQCRWDATVCPERRRSRCCQEQDGRAN